MAGRFTGQIVMRWRMAALLLAVIVSIALPYTVTRSTTDSALKARTWVAHTAEVRATVYELAYHLRDMEAATYSMLQGVRYKDVTTRIESARVAVNPLLQKLRGLTRDNAEQQTRLGALDAIIQGRLGLMDQARADYAANDVQAAYQDLARAIKLFNYRKVATTIVNHEEALLAKRNADAKHKARTSRLVFAWTTVAQLLLLTIVVVVSERQIGHRIRAERKTREAVARAQLIVQTVREPIAVLDSDLKLLTVNAAFVELYGADPSPDGRQSLDEVGEGAWNNGALLQRLTDVLARNRELWDYELEQTTADDVERHMLINARRMNVPDLDMPALLMTANDVTARVLAENEIYELNTQLEGKVEQISDVNRELEAFSYSVSHDLRAPLRHIAGFSDKLRDHLGESVDDKSTHYLEVIHDAARRMAQLIDDLLVYSRLGRGAMRMQPVDMQSLVQEARTMVMTDADGRRVEWRVAALPVVVCDENMMRTVWQNLLSNAVKYTGQRERAVIEVKVERGGRGAYEFTVKDNGAGFDSRYIDKLFGVFQRLHKASEFPGSGIGLANVRRIISRHGGRVWAEGELDQGAAFHFTLPASAAVGASA